MRRTRADAMSVALLTVLVTSTAYAFDAQVCTDKDFDAASYITFTTELHRSMPGIPKSGYNNPPPGVQVLATTEEDNAGKHRHIEMTLASNHGARLFQFNRNCFFDPGREILSVTVSYDVKRHPNPKTPDDSTTLNEVAKGLAVIQDGHTHYNTTVATITQTDWAHVTFDDVRAIFPAVDWSAAGGRITFGFYNSTYNAQPKERSLAADYDNFVVIIKPLLAQRRYPK